jgi:UDP-N-acetylglucosamine:LPS N-acetylglucosamine transferase
MIKLRSAFESRPHFVITTDADIRCDEFADFKQVYTIPDIGQGRWRAHPIKLTVAVVKVLWIFLREKPGFLLSTGSGIAVPCFFWAYFMHIKSIYVEAGTRFRTLSETGRFCYYFADLFFVQHTGLLVNWPKAVYHGALYGNLTT